tara:strand:+ start:299 stop:1408 length:1110 start_codon:yes stop_codon:yes gene_type:complete
MKIKNIKFFIFYILLYSFESMSFSTNDSLEYKIGQMLMFGIGDVNSVEDADSLLLELSKNNLGGIILFEKNVNQHDSYNNLKKLIDKIQLVSNNSLFIAIDEEGGRVNRLKTKYGFHRTRSAKSLGDENNLDSTYYYSKKTSNLLRELGINVNYAPSVDLSINLENPVIYKLERSFGRNPSLVFSHAKSFINAHKENKIISVLKHFPGHGSSNEDSHLGLTDVSDTWMIEELYPYKSMIDSGFVDAIMSAHVVNKRLDDKKLPGTLSSKIINGLLRNFLGFNGVVFSDDMQMQAITNHYGLEVAIEKSINSGIDILLFCNNQLKENKVSTDKVISIIKDKIQSGEIKYSRIEESFNRIKKLKQRFEIIN